MDSSKRNLNRFHTIFSTEHLHYFFVYQWSPRIWCLKNNKLPHFTKVNNNPYCQCLSMCHLSKKSAINCPDSLAVLCSISSQFGQNRLDDLMESPPKITKLHELQSDYGNCHQAAMACCTELVNFTRSAPNVVFLAFSWHLETWTVLLILNHKSTFHCPWQLFKVTGTSRCIQADHLWNGCIPQGQKTCNLLSTFKDCFHWSENIVDVLPYCFKWVHKLCHVPPSSQ